MARRRRKGSESSEVEEPTSAEQPSSGAPKQSGGSGLASALAFASDPPYISIYDDTAFETYSIVNMCSNSSIVRNLEFNNAQALNRPVMFDPVIQANVSDNKQFTACDPDLVGEVIFNELARTITTPGDISMNDMKTVVQQYVAHISNLIGMWASTAAIYGLSASFPNAAGQLKNYLALIGAKPWQQESKSTLMRELPIPTNLLQYLTSWYACKQIPDGRSMFCLPQQPIGMTPDEVTGAAISGYDLQAFEIEHANILALQDWPEMRRILMNAGWQTYDFPTSIPVIRDGQWWDMQVVNAPWVNVKYSDVNNWVQANPQAGESRRTYALSVYSENLSPWLQRGMMPCYVTTDSTGSYDRDTGAFDMAQTTTLKFGIASVGAYNLQGTLLSTGYTSPYRCKASVLAIGQVNGTNEIGWAGTIPGFTVEDSLAALYSEMITTMMTDASTPTTDPALLYEKIFAGESTTVGSNRLKFGNTVVPNTFGSPTNILNVIGTGDASTMQRIYTALLKA